MTATATPPIGDIADTRVAVAMLDLVRDLSTEAQALAVGAIQSVLNQGRFYDECKQRAFALNAEIMGLEHSSPSPCCDWRTCRRCQLEEQEQRNYRDWERVRLALGGRAR